MHIDDYDKMCREFSQKAIDAEFLMDIEKISRYKGDYISNEHNYVENLGTVRRTEWNDKIIINYLENGEIDVKVDKENKEREYVYYDLTLICNTSVCSEFNKFVLVSERPKYKELSRNERKLWIYLIKDYGDSTKLPTISKLKKAIRKGGYIPYRSLITEFCDVYNLTLVDGCDKMAALYTLLGDIEELKIENPELFEIKVFERIENNHEARQAYYNKKHKDEIERVNKLIEEKTKKLLST